MTEEARHEREQQRQFELRIFDALLTFAILVSMAVGAWALRSTIDLRERVAVIESNRFTKQDASRMEEELRSEMLSGVNDIKRCLNQIQRNQQCDF